MSGDIKASLRVDLDGNLLPQSRRYSQAINKLAKTGSRDMRSLGDTARSTGNSFKQLGNRMAALAAGVGVKAIVTEVGQMERRMTRLGIAANQSDEVIQKLKNDIYEAATSPDIRINPDKITTAIEQILELTGDFEFAKENIRNIGLALQSTDADAAAMGATFAELQKHQVKGSKAVLETIDTLNLQGKEGAFTWQNMAGLLPRLTAAYAAVGRSGSDAFREIGAAAQIARQATGSSEQATTSLEAVLRAFSDPKKIKGFKAAGIQIFDPAELKKGNEIVRPINVLMAEIVKKTKGRATLIHSLFGDAEAGRAFGNLIDEYKKTGKVDSIDRYYKMIGNGTQTLEDSRRAANNSAAAMEEFYAVLRKFADDKLTQPIHYLTDQLKGLIDNYDKAVNFTSGAIEKGVTIYNQVSHALAPESMKRPDAPANPARTRRAIPGTGGYVPYLPPASQTLGHNPQPAAPANPVNGHVTIEVVGDTPVKVRSLQAKSGTIDVKNPRAGLHFP